MLEFCLQFLIIFVCISDQNKHMKMEDKLCQKKNEKKKKFICQFCEQEYTFKTALKVHLQKHHQKTELHGCNQCDKFFDSASESAEHKKADHKLNVYQCKFCDKPFGDKHNKNRHMRNACSKSKCLICCKSFTNPAKLKYHEEMCCNVKDMPSKSQNSKIEPKMGTLSSDMCKPRMNLIIKKLETKSNDKFDSKHGKKHLLARIEELEEENRKMSLKIQTLETREG